MTRKAKAMCFVPNNDNKKCGKKKLSNMSLNINLSLYFQG